MAFTAEACFTERVFFVCVCMGVGNMYVLRVVERRQIMRGGKWAAWGKAWGQNHVPEQFD